MLIDPKVVSNSGTTVVSDSQGNILSFVNQPYRIEGLDLGIASSQHTYLAQLKQRFADSDCFQIKMAFLSVVFVYAILSLIFIPRSKGRSKWLRKKDTNYKSGRYDQGYLDRK